MWNRRGFFDRKHKTEESVEEDRSGLSRQQSFAMDRSYSTPSSPMPEPRVKSARAPDGNGPQENGSTASFNTGSTLSLEVEPKKKRGFFKRLTSHAKKSKLGKAETVNVEGDQPLKTKKKLFLGFGDRSVSQPDLLKKKSDPNAQPVVAAAVPLKTGNGFGSDDHDDRTPRRSSSVPKTAKTPRLTPVVETPSELSDSKRNSFDGILDAADSVLVSASSGVDPFAPDNVTRVAFGDLDDSDEEADRKSEAKGVQLQTRSMPGDERNAEDVPRGTKAFKEARMKKVDSTGKLGSVDGKGSQSDLGEPKKQAPPPLVRGQSSAKIQSWTSSVTIFLFEGKDLPAMDRNGFSDPFCKFRLGSEKYRTRIAYKTLNPRWMEQFDLFMYDSKETEIEITVWDWDRGMRNDYIGKAVIDLSTIQREKLNDLWLDVMNENEPCGSLHLSVMVSGQKLMTEKITEETEQQSETKSVENVSRYSLRNAFSDVGDVGTVKVKVFRGCGLRAADLNGKSDPYCVLQLVNCRLQTQVEPKTLDPEWDRVFTFPVNDIHTVLDITVLDMDQDKTSDFLGRVGIPLLSIHNNERRWYALKDSKLRNRSKGSILLEMELIYNPLRAAIRTVNPRETRFDETESKFKRQVFVRNVARIRNTFLPMLEMGLFIRSCLNWESKPRSIVAFISYLLAVYFFEIWMLPLALLMVFLRYYVSNHIVQSSGRDSRADDESADHPDDDTAGDDEDDPDDGGKAANTTILSKVRVAQEQLRTVQNLMGFGADLCERVQNTFQFVVPWLSYLGISVLCVGMVILYFIPVRLLLFVWGIHKFTKKLRKPHARGNNELLDFLSRVYTNDEIRMYKELRPREVSQAAAMGGINGNAQMRRDNSKGKLIG